MSMERLQRVLLFSVVLLAVIFFLTVDGQQQQQPSSKFSHRRIQSGPPKFNRRPPPGGPPPHRPRRPQRPEGPPPPPPPREGGGSRDRGPPPQYNNNNGGGKPYHQRQPPGPPHHSNNGPPPSGGPPSGPPPTRPYNNHHSNNNNNGPPNLSRPGPPYPPQNNNNQNYNNNNNNRPHNNNNNNHNHHSQPPLHPFTQQSPNNPNNPSNLNAPLSLNTHPQQPMTNPPISEYAPPLNTFKSSPNNNYNKDSSPSGAAQSQQINIGSGSNNTKHTITFTVTKKPSGATAINFQIQTPQNGGPYGPSTYRPPLDGSYPGTSYSMRDKDEASANDLLNPPPVFYNPQKDVLMNKAHPLNQMKNEIVHDPVKDYDSAGSSKFSQPDPLFHEEDDKTSDSSVASSISQILIAGQKPIKKINPKDQIPDANTAAAQLLAALGLSKNPLIDKGQGEPLGLTDYLKSHQPLFNKPDRIISQENGSNKKKDQDSASSQSESQFPNLYGDDFDSFNSGLLTPPKDSESSLNGHNDDVESVAKLSSYLQQRLQSLNRQQQNDFSSDASTGSSGSGSGNLYGGGSAKEQHVERAGPISYIEQRLKGGNNSPLSNAFGSPPTNNFGSNFGLLNNNNNENRQTSYLEQKLRQDQLQQQQQQQQNEQSYIQELLSNQGKPNFQASDLTGAYASASQQNIHKPLDLSQFAAHQQSRFGPSTQSPSSLEMEEYSNTKDIGAGSVFNGGHQASQFSEHRQQIVPPIKNGGGIGSLSSNVLLPGGFGGTHLQQQQQQQQFNQHQQLSQQQQQQQFQSPIFNRQQFPSGSGGQIAAAPSAVSPISHHSGSIEHGQAPYNYPQETQHFQQRLNFDQQQHQQQQAQYAAVNPLQQTPQQQQFPQSQQFQFQQHQQFSGQQGQQSIQNFNYQQAPQQQQPQQQQLSPAQSQQIQQTHPHPNAIPPPGYGPPGHIGGPPHGPHGGGFGPGGDFGPGGPGGPGGGFDGPAGFDGGPTPPPQQVYVVTEAEPIIEIIVQDSNVTLPPHQIPLPPPPPPPTPEPVHVFYVKYSENKFPHGGPHDGAGHLLHEPEINLESPIPSINVRGPGGHHHHHGGGYGPDRNLQVDPNYDNVPQLSESHPQTQQHVVNVSSPPPASSSSVEEVTSSTTLRTIINPSQNSFTNTKLAVHFDSPPEAYPFDMAKYQKQFLASQNNNNNKKDNSEQQQHQNQREAEQKQLEQQEMHQQMMQHFEQHKNQFLNKRIGVEDFSSLLDEEPGHQGQGQGPHSQQNNHDKSKELPPDVPHHLKQQLINSGILNNAEVQVVNFDENLFKELSSLPPEAISALQQQQQQQTEFSSQNQQNYEQEDFSNLQKRHVNKIFIEKRGDATSGVKRSLKKRPRSILFQTEDNHLYRLLTTNIKKGIHNEKIDKIC